MEPSTIVVLLIAAVFLACLVAYVVLTRNRALRNQRQDDTPVPGEDGRGTGRRLSM